MMNKSGAGWLRLFAVYCFYTAASAEQGSLAWGQTPMVSEVPATNTEDHQAAPEANPSFSATTPTSAVPVDFQYTFSQRLADLSTASLDQLRSELAKAEAKADEVDLAGFQARIQAAREAVRANSDEVKALLAQITRIYAEIDEAIGRDPVVMAAEADAMREHMQFMDQLNLRSGLLKLIAEKERQAKWPVPEPTPEERTP